MRPAGAHQHGPPQLPAGHGASLVPFAPAHRRHELAGRQVVDIPLRRPKVGVPELGADHVHRHSLAGELDGVRVAEPVRMHPLGDPGPRGVTLEHRPHVSRPERLASSSPRTGVRAEHRAAARHELTAHKQPTLEQLERSYIDPDDAPAVALPVQHRDAPGVAVYVFRLERESLGDAKPAPPQEHHERAVPHPRRRAPRERPKQRIDLRARQRLRRQTRAHGRHRNRGAGPTAGKGEAMQRAPIEGLDARAENGAVTIASTSAIDGVTIERHLSPQNARRLIYRIAAATVAAQDGPGRVFELRGQLEEERPGPRAA